MEAHVLHTVQTIALAIAQRHVWAVVLTGAITVALPSVITNVLPNVLMGLV